MFDSHLVSEHGDVSSHRRRKVNKSGGAELTRERSDRVRGGFGRGLPNGEKF